jgi:hypothetical protein
MSAPQEGLPSMELVTTQLLFSSPAFNSTFTMFIAVKKFNINSGFNSEVYVPLLGTVLVCVQ